MTITAWRFGTFAVGLYLLYFGSLLYHAPDWDLGVSVLMAVATAAVMPMFHGCVVVAIIHKVPTARVLAGLQAFFIGCFPVQVVYSLYWQWMGTPEVQAFENFGASWVLFLACWVIWYLVPAVLKTHQDGEESSQPRR